MADNVQERFWAKVQKTETCWLWTASGGRGYGLFWPSGPRSGMAAHRFAYELLVGPIPAGLQLDHLCGVKACVNPAHLEPVTGLVNRQRAGNPIARNGFKTHCAQGHPFDEANTFRAPSRPTERRCRACSRVIALRAYYRRKAIAK